MGDTGRRRRRSCRLGRTGAIRHRGPRHHQPARNDAALAPRNRSADLPGHRLVGPAHARQVRRPLRRRPRRMGPPKDRSAADDLRQRLQDCLDLGPCSERPQAGSGRQTLFRHGRHLAGLELHRPRPSRHRRLQRLEDATVQHRPPAVGSGAATLLQHPGLDPAAHLLVGRRFWTNRSALLARGCAHHRYPR